MTVLTVMKRSLLILTVLLVTGLSKPVFSQWMYGAFSTGLNLTQVDGDEEYGYKKFGFTGGPSVIKPFGKNRNWSVTMELLFSMKGSRQRSDFSPADSIADSLSYYDGYKLDLNYVEIPLLVHYTDKKMIAAGVGFSYGQRVGYKELEDHNDITGWRHVDTAACPYENVDLSVIADLRIRLYKRLWLNGRFTYSMLPIRTREFVVAGTPDDVKWTRKQYNNVISIRLTYIFNEPLPFKNKKKAN